MKKLLLFFAIVSLASGIGFAQKASDIFDFDYAQFEYDSTSNFVELYYSFNQDAMAPTASDSLSYVEGILSVSIKDTATGKTVVDKKWKIVHPVADTNVSSDKSLVGMISFALPQGTFKCVVGGLDMIDTTNKKYINEIIHVQPFSHDSLGLSDIQLASRILQNSKDTKSIFYKNTFEVTPIPTLVFGQNLPVVFYYYEVYENDGGNGGLLKIRNTIFNSRGKAVFSRDRIIRKGVKSRVEVGSVPINKYPTDTYLMRVTLLDSAANQGVTSSKRFFVYNPNVKKVVDTAQASAGGVVSSVFGVMSAEECDDLFAKSKYIANSQEVSQYGKLSKLEAKREFLFNFWRKRDNTPGTKQNEYFQAYLKRISEANQKYGSFNKAGWKTDRGRVLLKYGEPSEIDRFPNQTDTKPYEVWRYNDLEGGVIFVFADLTGFSDYQLVHSTMRGEMRDDNWERRIQTY